MATSLKLGLKTTQRLAITQSLRQSIEMLQLSTIELSDLISAEMIENPVLEEENVSTMPSIDIDESELISRINKRLSGDENIYLEKKGERLAMEDLSDRGYSSAVDDDDRKQRYIDNAIVQEETLEDHLLWQARLIAVSESEYSLYERIITSIDENGFLTVPIDDLAADAALPRQKLADLIDAISGLDPIGCGVPGLRESLLVQARHYFAGDEHLIQILRDHFDDLERLNYERIARSLSVSLEAVIEKCKLIQHLDPFPGRQYNNSVDRPRYVIPDIDVKYLDDEILVNMNDDWMPKISINSYYIDLLQKKRIEKNIKEFIQGKVQSAKHLLKNIENRKDTIIRVVYSIMQHQQKFLRNGPGNLNPLTHIDVARDVGLHESTVSRVTSNKFIQTSWGVFPLKYFFVSRLRSANEEDQSSDKIMNMVREIISAEDSANPLSDDEIVQRLKNDHINLARRTVAKYRGIMRIPPSNRRKKINLYKKKEPL